MSSLPSSSLLLKLPTVKITNMISDYLLECVCASLNTNKKKGTVGRSYRAKKKVHFSHLERVVFLSGQGSKASHSSMKSLAKRSN